jgi:hypothetical protein
MTGSIELIFTHITNACQFAEATGVAHVIPVRER